MSTHTICCVRSVSYPCSPIGQLFSVLILKFWKAYIRNSFPVHIPIMSSAFLGVKFEIVIMVTLKIAVLWCDAVLLNLMMEAACCPETLLSHPRRIQFPFSLPHKFCVGFWFKIMCSQISTTLSWDGGPGVGGAVTEAAGKKWSNVGAQIPVTGTLNGCCES